MEAVDTFANDPIKQTKSKILTKVSNSSNEEGALTYIFQHVTYHFGLKMQSDI